MKRAANQADRTARSSSPPDTDHGSNPVLVRIITMIGTRIAAEWIRELVLALWQEIDRRL